MVKLDKIYTRGGDAGESGLWADTGVGLRGTFHQGEPILRFKETTGDHLFVDRYTYNFRKPERGEIVVFKTRGIQEIKDQSQPSK